jgi:hypothetical protein
MIELLVSFSGIICIALGEENVSHKIRVFGYMCDTAEGNLKNN